MFSVIFFIILFLVCVFDFILNKLNEESIDELQSKKSTKRETGYINPIHKYILKSIHNKLY